MGCSHSKLDKGPDDALYGSARPPIHTAVKHSRLASYNSTAAKSKTSRFINAHPNVSQAQQHLPTNANVAITTPSQQFFTSQSPRIATVSSRGSRTVASPAGYQIGLLNSVTNVSNASQSSSAEQSNQIELSKDSDTSFARDTMSALSAVNISNVANRRTTESCSAPDNSIHFRRQHFDRSSVLRHSKRRSKKNSTTSVVGASSSASPAVSNAVTTMSNSGCNMRPTPTIPLPQRVPLESTPSHNEPPVVPCRLAVERRLEAALVDGRSPVEKHDFQCSKPSAMTGYIEHKFDTNCESESDAGRHFIDRNSESSLHGTPNGISVPVHATCNTRQSVVDYSDMVATHLSGATSNDVNNNVRNVTESHRSAFGAAPISERATLYGESTTDVKNKIRIGKNPDNCQTRSETFDPIGHCSADMKGDDLSWLSQQEPSISGPQPSNPYFAVKSECGRLI